MVNRHVYKQAFVMAAVIAGVSCEVAIKTKSILVLLV